MASGNRGLVHIFCKPRVFPFCGHLANDIVGSSYSCTPHGNVGTRTKKKKRVGQFSMFSFNMKMHHNLVLTPKDLYKIKAFRFT